MGDIVVALDEDNQNTLKTFAGIDTESGLALLRYENEKKYPGEVIHVRELIVQGIAKHVIKALRSSDANPEERENTTNQRGTV